MFTMPVDKQIAPQGDLYILIGQGDESKLARVSKVILSIASPVFGALLSPQVSSPILGMISRLTSHSSKRVMMLMIKRRP